MASPNRIHDRRFFYKYVTAETAKAVLRSRTLRWSSPSLFNDPFDTPRQLTFGCTTRQIQEALAEEIARLIESRADTPAHAPRNLRLLLTVMASGDAEARNAVVNDLRTEGVNSLPDPVGAFAGFDDYWRETIPKLRILCMSECADIPLMWAHYAAGHRGAVLEFEALDAVDSALLTLKPVIYQAEVPQLPPTDYWVQQIVGGIPLDHERIFNEYQYAKGLHWAYEREWRRSSYARPGETGDFADYGFFAEELTRVIVGAQCSQADEEEIGRLLAAAFPRATMARARIDTTTGAVLV
jgi:hypothetical protein